MSYRKLLSLVLLTVVAACSDNNTAPPTVPNSPDTPQQEQPRSPRERLAARLAAALNDPGLRADLAERFAKSHAPEGKLQFQALARLGNRHLLASLASAGDGSMADLLADLNAARGLEVYLPVPAQRAAWHGGADLLVATAAGDHERPVAFDLAGNRTLLSATEPPATPVIALVPQEFDFTGGRPELQMACWDVCPGSSDIGIGGDVSGSSVKEGGLYLVATHFADDFEGWLKGSPEYEFHVYGSVHGKTEELACTAERARGPYRWDTNNRDWRGRVALLTKGDIDKYKAVNSKPVIRIVAWEDDDTACVPVTNANSFADLVKRLSDFYKKYTGFEIKTTFPNGVTAAYAGFGLAQAVRNFILTGDDLIGLGIEKSIVGWNPGSANIVLKGENAITNGWFETDYVR